MGGWGFCCRGVAHHLLQCFRVHEWMDSIIHYHHLPRACLEP